METKIPRGRPRPKETIDRDERVLRLVCERPRTRNELRELMRMDPGTEVLVYLSLSRLRQRGKVRLCQGSGADRVWTADVDSPCP